MPASANLASAIMGKMVSDAFSPWIILEP